MAASAEDRHLVLVGGGHAHVAVIKAFGERPLPGVRLTVVARDVKTPYSGMLPGFVAGHYGFDDVHVDLEPLCRFARAGLVHDTVVGLDPQARLIARESGAEIGYDLVSVDIGSRPQTHGIAGAAEHTVPVKPIDRFVARWESLVARAQANPAPHRIVVIGAGAAGTELLLAVQYRLRTLLTAAGRSDADPVCHLVSRTPRILPRFSEGVARRFERVLAARGVTVHRGQAAEAIEADRVRLADGTEIPADEILLVTGASAQPWVREAGLATDAGGFLEVDRCLRSTSHPSVFAAGDIAHMRDDPREKAGVVAVRQGPVLAENLRRALTGESLEPFRPQKTMLALISTGDACAVAAKGPFSAEGRWVWRWKDWIDRRWMARYRF